MAKRSQRPDPAKKARRRVARAQDAYSKREDRVGALRLRLARAEQKLTRRAAHLARAQAMLAVLTGAATPEAAADDLAALAKPNSDAAGQNGVAPAAKVRSRRKMAPPDA